jgi:hypothetical protein
MAQIEGLQVNILADITQLQKSLDQVKKALASVAQESQKQSDKISNPLKGAADAIEARYGWVAGQIATKLASLVNPATLAATAVTAIGAGLLAYFQSVQTNTASADEVLKTHGQIIKDLKAAYGEAMVGLEQYTKETDDSFRNRIGASLTNLQKGVMEFSKTFIEQFGYLKYGPIKDAETGITTFGDTIQRLPAKFEPFRGALETLQASIRAGNPDYITFKNSVDAIGAAAVQTNPALNATAKELVDGADKGFLFSTGINASKDSLYGMSAEARAAAANLNIFNSAISKLESFGPKKSRLEEIQAEARASKLAARDDLEYLRAVNAEKAALKELDKDKKPTRTPAVKVDNSEEQLAREQESIAKRLEMLNLGWGTEEEKLAAHLVRNQDLINLANQKKVIDDDTHKILMLGAEEEYQKKMEGLRMAGINSALTATGEVFSAMARVVQSGGKKNVRLAKMFGVAEAIIATFVAANKAMAAYSSGGPVAAFAAWAAVAAKGLATVAAIRSVSESGGGGSAAGAASGGGGGGAAASADGAAGRGPGGNSVYINLQGQSFGRDQVRDLVKQIADFQKDGGQVVFA